MNGGLAYADWENGTIWFVGAGAQNEEIFTLPEGQGFTYASLESVGDKLFLSYSADTGANDVRNTGLIELSAGRRLSEELRYIIQGRAQSDGSIQLMLTNTWPSNFLSTTKEVSRKITIRYEKLTHTTAQLGKQPLRQMKTVTLSGFTLLTARETNGSIIFVGRRREGLCHS